MKQILKVVFLKKVVALVLDNCVVQRGRDSFSKEELELLQDPKRTLYLVNVSKNKDLVTDYDNAVKIEQKKGAGL